MNGRSKPRETFSKMYEVWLFPASSDRTRPTHFYLGPEGQQWDRCEAIDHGFQGTRDEASQEADRRSKLQPNADTVAIHTVSTIKPPKQAMAVKTYNLKTTKPATPETVTTGEKLPTSTAIPLTTAEKTTCEKYARLLAAIKKIDALADNLKGDVVEIVNRCGPQSFQRGRLIPSWSNSYPVPSLEEWTARVEKQRGMFDATVSAMWQLAHGQPLLRAELKQEGGLSDTTLAGLDEPYYPVSTYIEQRATLQQMEEWTHFVKEYEECEAWMKSMKTFFDAAGVIIPKKSPGVKRLESNPPPRRRKAPQVFRDEQSGEPTTIVVEDDIPM